MCCYIFPAGGDTGNARSVSSRWREWKGKWWDGDKWAGPATSQKKWRPKQLAAKNLLDDLLRRADQVLAFLDDLCIPFTNNQAERDLRMVSRSAKDGWHLF
jgi:hypothetical protein